MSAARTTAQSFTIDRDSDFAGSPSAQCQGPGYLEEPICGVAHVSVTQLVARQPAEPVGVGSA